MTNTTWTVKAGNDVLAICAAYPQQGIRQPDGTAVLTLKDATHQVVFAAPTHAVVWLYRADVGAVTPA